MKTLILEILLFLSLGFLAYLFLTGRAWVGKEDEEEEVDEERRNELIKGYKEKVVPIKNYVAYLNQSKGNGTISEEEYNNEMKVCYAKMDSFMKEYGLEEKNERD